MNDGTLLANFVGLARVQGIPRRRGERRFEAQYWSANVNPSDRYVLSLPGSLDEALIALENDHEFLLKGDVFTTSMIERWITYKRENEITPLRLRPHPLEFSMYYDI